MPNLIKSGKNLGRDLAETGPVRRGDERVADEEQLVHQAPAALVAAAVAHLLDEQRRVEFHLAFFFGDLRLEV